MINFKPIHDKVIGKMIEQIGSERKTKSGVILSVDDPDASDFIRPRWFQVTHVGPEQTDVKVGQYVLVEHGRWSRGFNLEGSLRESDKLFNLDIEHMLMVSDENPVT